MRLIGFVFALLLAVAPAAAPAAAEEANRPLGTVTISYELHRIPSIASNQLAVWIEDPNGQLVKTLFVTWFTGKGGYERRPDCLPLWRKAAGVEGPPTEAVDAVTRATQQPGRRTVVWDGTDAAGRAVPPGKYVYKVEGNLFWAREVVWTGEIVVGGGESSSRAAARYSPEEAAGGDRLVTDVRAVFTPAGGPVY